jgi:hypothetical protein
MNKKQLNEAIAVIEDAVNESTQDVNEIVGYLINYLKTNKDEILESAQYEDFDVDDEELF